MGYNVLGPSHPFKSMPHPLEARIDSVRRRAARLLWLYGLSRCLMAALGILAAFAALDFVLRLRDSGMRWAASAMALAFLAWAFWLSLRPLLRLLPSRVEAARRIESVYPQLSGRLSSAIDFLSQREDDARAGSSALRRVVVNEAESMSANLNFGRAIDAREPRQAATLAAVLATIAGIVIVTNWPAANLAMTRLVQPWNQVSWPRRNELQFVQRLEKLAAGDDFEVELVDRRGPLPELVQIQLRYEVNGLLKVETKNMKPLGERMVFRLGNLNHAIEYRARGGDDDTMPWIRLAVVEPPKVVDLNVIVKAPPYTRLPDVKTGHVIKAITGSTLTVTGRVNKPIAAAKLHGEPADVSLPKVAIAADGMSFSLEGDGGVAWKVERSGTFWLETADRDGLKSPHRVRLELHAIQDMPPSISWATPADHTPVAPQGIAKLKCQVRDDLSVKSVELRYLQPDDTGAGEHSITLFTAHRDTMLPKTSLAEDSQQSIEFDWDLTTVAGLVPGDILHVWLTASDYKPQQATTTVRRLAVVAPEELEARVAERQSSILQQLSEALRIQRDCREQISALQIRQEESESPDVTRLSRLHSIQLNQRGVDKLLGESSEGVESQIAALLEDLVANRIDNPGLTRRMNELLSEIRQINQGPLVDIRQQLTEASKALRAGGEVATADETVVAILERAGASQDQVIRSLESILNSLAPWDSFSRLAREIGKVRADQQQVAEETEALRLKLLTITTSDLGADNRALLRQLEQRELELARRLDKIQGRMAEMRTRLGASDPTAAITLEKALYAASQMAIGGQMRQAADSLTQRELGVARRMQQSISEDLRRLLDLLSSRRDSELASSVQSLGEASEELENLLRAQQHLQSQLAAAARESDSEKRRSQVQQLTKELEQLAASADELSQQLATLAATKAAASTAAAAKAAAAAALASAGNDDPGAQSNLADAGERLEDALRQLQQDIASSEQQLTQQQMALLMQHVRAFLIRQRSVASQLSELETNTADEIVRAAAAEERQLATEVDQLRMRINRLDAFAFALDLAKGDMLRCATLIEQGEVRSPARTAAESAAEALAQILAALEPDTAPQLDPPPGQQADQPSDNPPHDPPELQINVAELKLLQSLQTDVYRQTTEIETARAKSGTLTPTQHAALRDLASGQRRLAEMVLKLLRAPGTASADASKSPTMPPAADAPAKFQGQSSLNDELLKGLD